MDDLVFSLGGPVGGAAAAPAAGEAAAETAEVQTKKEEVVRRLAHIYVCLNDCEIADRPSLRFSPSLPLAFRLRRSTLAAAWTCSAAVTAEATKLFPYNRVLKAV